MITGLLNIVAFKAIDKYGMPLDIEGEIKSDKGEVITNFKTLHDGMGTFPIIPQPGSNYFATINGSAEQYPLPQQTTNGIAFTVRSTSRGKQFKIQYNNENETFKPAYLIGQMENEVIFTHELPSDKKEISGIIPTADSYSGILHLTIFNKDNMPLAERLTFIDNKEYLLPAEFKIDTLNTDQHKRNRFSIALQDTIIGNFSVSITDADYDDGGMRPQNIYSWFLLNSDIKGYVHNPAYYFNSPADSIKNALDLVMMTHGWTRFKWSDVSQNKLPAAQFKDPAYINLSGLITIEGTKKPLVNQDIIAFKSPLDTSSKQRGIPLMLKTDSEGRFKLDSQVLYDKYKILFSEVRGKKANSYELNYSPTPSGVHIPYNPYFFR
ncbi:hypothetical protein [Niabella ginsengisoli]|uniref:Carboxypeptidase regulatory-like domain-containing protein n=1 Tax=Niabella ginsengisoli TaxID=522298 RepID=A0ABS9SGV3_9BACT|nr:hypothetical protein [Niabella ginsengisoli]MCH5597593.1 hypothetical protein [Niabella ginsengisoli]